MLRYFGEHAPEYCGKCSNCLTSFEEVDITETVRDIIGCINDCYRGYGTGTILETLRGNNTERSDVDIAVYGGDFDSFYWDIKENIHSLLMFDVINADASISEELKKEIKKDGVVIYEKA